jgi:hypothetical protein
MLGGFQDYISSLPTIFFIPPLPPKFDPGPADGSYPPRRNTLSDLLEAFDIHDWCGTQQPPPAIAAEDWISANQLDQLMTGGVEVRLFQV